jgi:hypothetical protein
VSQVITKAPAYPCLLQHCSQQLSYENSQDALVLLNGLRKCGIYIHGILLSHKEDEILSFTGKWMELENIIFSEVSQLRRPKATCSPSYVDSTPKTNAAILGDTGHTKGRCDQCRGGIGQGKETRNLNEGDVLTVQERI